MKKFYLSMMIWCGCWSIFELYRILTADNLGTYYFSICCYLIQSLLFLLFYHVRKEYIKSIKRYDYGEGEK
jgi:hypothetical protein